MLDDFLALGVLHKGQLRRAVLHLVEGLHNHEHDPRHNEEVDDGADERAEIDTVLGEMCIRDSIVACEFPQFWFVNVYTPNSQMELARIDHRMEWDDAFRDFCKGLEAGVLPDGSASDPKPVVMCGDFNVAHEEIDLKNPGPNRGASGFSDEERGKFTELVDAGFTDTFRLLHPDETGRYSWWSYRFRARSTNAGWRIDYFLVSDELRDRVVAASIYDDVEGSDHCPVGLELDLD